MTHDDPVLAQRARIARWADTGQRTGYLLYGLAIVTFVVAFVVGFSNTTVTIIVAALVTGSIVLAPAIIAGYAVRAAHRADRDDDW